MLNNCPNNNSILNCQKSVFMEFKVAMVDRDLTQPTAQLISWGISSDIVFFLKLQKRVKRTMNGVSSRMFCRKLFKPTDIYNDITGYPTFSVIAICEEK